MSEPVTWEGVEGIDATPRSERFGEAYRSRSGGLAQARAVFLAGCGLPACWRGRSEFRLLETGFGLGLNFLATWLAWEADPQRPACLDYAAVEAYPVAAVDLLRSARQALATDRAASAGAPSSSAAALDALDDARLPVLATVLGEAWSRLHPGVQCWTLDAGRGAITLRLAIGPVQAMLTALAAAAPSPVNAVYLDGFSPAVNPAMWTDEVLQAVAARCAPGAGLATYSTARPVRERLAACGFTVRRQPGLPPKRHRLAAVRLAQD